MESRIIIFAFALSLGCMADASPMVRVQAASDFVCPEQQVQVTHTSGQTYEAYGCGKRRRYFATCQGTQCLVTRDGSPANSLQPRRRAEHDISPRQPVP